MSPHHRYSGAKLLQAQRKAIDNTREKLEEAQSRITKIDEQLEHCSNANAAAATMAGTSAASAVASGLVLFGPFAVLAAAASAVGAAVTRAGTAVAEAVYRKRGAAERRKVASLWQELAAQEDGRAEFAGQTPEELCARAAALESIVLGA